MTPPRWSARLVTRTGAVSNLAELFLPVMFATFFALLAVLFVTEAPGLTTTIAAFAASVCSLLGGAYGVLFVAQFREYQAVRQ